MKRFVACLVFSLLSVTTAQASSIVIEADSGKVLYSDKADSKRHPASLTKMMTLYLAFEALKDGRLKPNQELTVSRLASRRSPSKLYLKPGQKIKVDDAIKALITKSANDVATVIAEALGGTETKFAQKMTAKAKALGMRHTTFVNASGLPNWRQLTTARDMAILGIALIKHFPGQYKKFSLAAFEYKNQVYPNHNRLLRCYGDVDGIKTGYIRSSGFNLVASAEINGKRIVGVVIGYRTKNARDRKMVKLLNMGFTKLEREPTKLSNNCRQANR